MGVNSSCPEKGFGTLCKFLIEIPCMDGINNSTGKFFAGGVGPRQVLGFMGKFRKKEALLGLRMAILGLKLPYLRILKIVRCTRHE
jgi:hypothetical protein